MKVIHSRTFSRTGLTREAGPFGPKDFSGRYLLYVENESCRCLEYYGLGTKTSACVFTCLSGVTFLLCKCLYRSSLLWAVSNEHGEMNASERTMASCAMSVQWLPFEELCRREMDDACFRCFRSTGITTES